MVRRGLVLRLEIAQGRGTLGGNLEGIPHVELAPLDLKRGANLGFLIAQDVQDRGRLRDSLPGGAGRLPPQISNQLA